MSYGVQSWCNSWDLLLKKDKITITKLDIKVDISLELENKLQTLKSQKSTTDFTKSRKKLRI